MSLARSLLSMSPEVPFSCSFSFSVSFDFSVTFSFAPTSLPMMGNTCTKDPDERKGKKERELKMEK